MTVPQPGIFAQGTRTHHHLELWRRSTPWGTAGEQDLSFLAVSADPSRFHRTLERMFGATPDGLHDALTDLSEPQSAAICFAPSIESSSTLSSL